MAQACDHPLHGITVVVDTAGPTVYIGRYHSETDGVILLHDVDVRDVGDAEAKAAYLARSARFGVFKNSAHARVPRSEVTSVRKLVEYAERT